ncbi:MAG: DUF748 domain-containing protein [Bacteroidales bacterium]|jgi:hypothetical protein
MKMVITKFIKTLITVIIFIISIVVLIILLISPIAKYLVEKNDVKYTGRQIKMGWVYVNPFTGYVYIGDLKIYESKSHTTLAGGDSLFFTAKRLSANFAMLKLFSKTVEIKKLVLDHPRGIIIQNKNDLNFNDLIKKFTPEKTEAAPSRIHFNILRISIKNGEFYYHENVTPINYFIKEVNIESAGKLWDADTIGARISFLSGIGTGSVTGNLTINFKNLDYSLAAVVQKFDLNIIGQYLKDLINYGSFSANLDADIKVSGNFNNQENINVKGLLAINDFHFGRNPDDDYAFFDKLILKIDELSPRDHKYLLDSITLTHPFLKYEIYDYLDNMERMFGKKGANISSARKNPTRFNLILKIADYVKVLVKNFFQSSYKINKLAIYGGCIKFNDYALTEKFSIEANPLYVVADSFNKNGKRVVIYFKSGIMPYGNIAVNLSINPKDSGDFDMQYHIQKLPASMFNPYLITYTSFSLDRGTIELNGTWKVRNSIIKSDNHLLVTDPRLSRRLRNKDTKWIPMPLIMFFIRERGNFIDYKIPITGNLKNPSFHLSDVIFDILGNIFIKPATIPYGLEVKNIENEIEKSLTLNWRMRQNSLLPDQGMFLNKIADFLINNPEASIDVYPMQYAEKEKEYILFFEAKERYYLLLKDKNAQVFNKEDSLKVDKMSVKDSLFVHFLDKQVNDTMLFTIQQKCNKYIDSAIVSSKFEQLNIEREEAFILPFRKKAAENQVIIHNGENNIPYNGFSFYKLVYKGEFPEFLIKAYQQMNDLNDVAPGKRFKEERQKIEIVK